MPVSFPPKLRAAVLALLLLASPACADETPVSAQQKAEFAAYLAQYRSEAAARGLDPAWIDATLDGAALVPRVIGADRSQPGSAARPVRFPDYLAAKFRGDRIPHGQRKFAEHAAQLAQAEEASGVPAPVIAAIWGIETSYGRVLGRTDLPSAIATLAFEGRRRELFTRELDALVRMVGEGRVTRASLTGSWAGAFGQAQFLPTSYLAHGADGDGDGRVDLWDSPADVFASIGRYLKDAGWQAGENWGFRVLVPDGFARGSVAAAEPPARCVVPLSRHSALKPAAEWRALGFTPVNGAWPGDAVPMSLIEPDGEGQGAYLVTRSYRAILGYNCSNLYALSVALLADTLRQPAIVVAE
ncbi:lytic murein transglycosylase [Sandarakinorhabdus rubra]|uniref:lytic murein transglycosylase n=1 Tax=Sandarakinorhabdus rubra TaxID=2672568 RepID=UPI0013DB870B|nr:lytic murein transglycosylase [Sandarakinorhabdus rubra]